MMVLVKKPDGSYIEIEVNIRGVGQDCLDEVCRQLGIIESDYFGLQYQNRKGEQLWLNLRNPIQWQVPYTVGMIQNPVKLALRVKFHTAPHNLQQEITRHLFYQDAKLSILDGKVNATQKEGARIAALAYQAEFGDCPGNVQSVTAPLFPAFTDDEEFKAALSANYSRLRGMKKSYAEYRFLQELSEMDSYGMDTYAVKDPRGRSIDVSIGSRCIVIEDVETKEVQRTNLDNIVQNAVDGKICCVTYLVEEEGEITTQTSEFKMNSKEQAEGFYRCITEKYEFYVSDHVRQAVLAQNVRDFRGSFISLFHINSDLGKRYSFDVRRTCREVQEATRRELHRTQASECASNGELLPSVSEHEKESSQSEDCTALMERLHFYEDAMLCKVCMSSNLNTALLPCGHLFCSDCSERLTDCPNCRVPVQKRQRIFMPDLQQLAS